MLNYCLKYTSETVNTSPNKVLGAAKNRILGTSGVSIAGCVRNSVTVVLLWKGHILF